MSTARHETPIYLRGIQDCRQCKKATYLRDVVAAPEGAFLCCENRSEDPDHQRKLDQEAREGLALKDIERNMFNDLIAPPAWQPLRIGGARYYLWQIQGVHRVRWERENKTVWYIDVASCNGHYSGNIEDEWADALIALGVPTEGYESRMWSAEKTWTISAPARRQLGFIQVQRPRVLKEQEDDDAQG